jgi:predicted deacylase
MTRRVTEDAALDLDALTPGRHRLVLSIATGDGRDPIEVPVHVFVGLRAHPRLAVVGGVHGDEYDGIRAAQSLAKEQAPEALDGTLVVIPVANPSAFAAGQRPTAIDNVDLNRTFPGYASGGVTERLAYALCDKVLKHMDLVFTLHGGGAVTRLAWYLEFLDVDSDVGRRSYAAAAAAGFDNLIAFPDTKGYLLPALGKLGVPVIEGEVGGRGELRASNVDYYRARVAAVMKHLGLTAGAPEALPSSKIWRNQDVLAQSTGVFQRDVDLHDPVRKGQCFGRVLDVEGEVLSEITCPYDGIVGGFRGHSWIQVGQMAVRIFVPAETRS